MRQFLFLIWFTQFQHEALAFPELTRHNYTNCTVCHVSPTGGGVLSEYGRSLSKELVSTWGVEGEEKFLYVTPSSEKVALGGDFRFMETEVKPPAGTKKKRWITMQRDLEVALTLTNWVAAVTVGENTMATRGSKLLSRRHYLMYKANDELSFRGGRFYPSFGLHLPDHTAIIRRGLGWDQNRETYNFETAWQGEKWQYFATAVFGRPDDKTVDRQKGLTLSTAYQTGGSSKFGFSYYYGENPDVISHYFGPYTVIPLGEKFYVMGQMTGTRNYIYTATEHQWGLVDYLKLNFEPYKGIHFFVTQEFSQSNLNSQTARTDIHSLGFQFFPRPHFEFQVTAYKGYSQGTQNAPIEGLNLLMHFYP